MFLNNCNTVLLRVLLQYSYISCWFWKANTTPIEFKYCSQFSMVFLRSRVMMLFRPELGWSVLELLGRFAVSGHWAPLQNKKQKGLAGARSLPLRCLSQFFPMEEKINCLGNEVLCICMRTFHRWCGLVFIMDDHYNFPSWMMTQNSIFPY